MPGSNEDEPLEALRKLILAEQSSRVDALNQRLDTLEHRIVNVRERALVVGEVLPEALRDSGGVDSALQQALQPEVEHAIHQSVRQEPTVIAEAIYPVMGPVIRKIVEKMFEGATAPSLNPYQVEQLFLIHRQSGLIIRHQVADGVVSQDADMISGMLDAIRSFVQEAFDAHDFDGLNHMNVGDVNVRIEWSPLVVLAAVVRGIEPQTLQPELQQTLQKIHASYEHALTEFDGNSEPFEALSLELQQVLRVCAKAQPVSFFKRHAKALALSCLAVLLLVIGVSVLDNRSWQHVLDKLAEQPGIVVVEQEHGFGRDYISALVDQDADSPEDILRAGGVDLETVELQWAAYISDEPQIKQRRAARLLQLPSGVFAHVQGRELFVSGDIPGGWINWAQSQAHKIDGIDSIDQIKQADPQWRQDR